MSTHNPIVGLVADLSSTGYHELCDIQENIRLCLKSMGVSIKANTASIEAHTKGLHELRNTVQVLMNKIEILEARSTEV